MTEVCFQLKKDLPSHHRIAAIKDFRNVTGCSLKVAVELIQSDKEYKKGEIFRFTPTMPVKEGEWFSVFDEERAQKERSFELTRALVNALVDSQQYDAAIDMLHFIEKHFQ